MDNFQHRSSQDLEKIGPIYSTKDEKQRIIAQKILDLKIRPVLKIKVNSDIPGLDKKKVLGFRNTSYYRLFSPLSSYGKTGVRYIGHQANVSRFLVPLFVFGFYYYNCANYFLGTYYKLEHNNKEFESVYFKMQNTSTHFGEKFCLMA